MNTQQAIGLIKEALDQSTANGTFKNINYVSALTQALMQIQDELSQKEKGGKDNDKKTNS